MVDITIVDIVMLPSGEMTFTEIAMENPPMLLSSVNHLFRLGPSIPGRTVK